MSVELFNKYFPPETSVALVDPDDGCGFRITIIEHSPEGTIGKDSKGRVCFVPKSVLDHRCLQTVVDDDKTEGVIDDDDDDDDDEILGELARKLKAKIIASHQSEPDDAHDEDVVVESRWGRKG